jgi:hypothetical protein
LQIAHDVCAASGANVPALHTSQYVCDDFRWYFPAAQLVQWAAAL